MPRGRGSSRGGGHKGQRRHFTSPEALEAEKEKVAREKQWRKERGDDDDSEEEEEGEGKASASSEEESSSEEDEETKAKGVQHLIDVENPNRVVRKAKKVEELNPEEEGVPKPQLSRREREELEKQQARAHYLKMHAAGKTDEARQDLARLALIKKQREEAAKKRDEEKKKLEATKTAKTEATKAALGKKT